MDLRHISQFLQTVTLPADSIVFVVTAKNDPFLPYKTIGLMAGSTSTKTPIHTNGDEIISTTGVQGVNGRNGSKRSL